MSVWHKVQHLVKMNVRCAGAVFIVGKGADLLNVLVANWSSKYFLSLGMFSGVGAYGNLSGRFGGLVRSIGSFVMADTWSFCSFENIGYGYDGGRIETARHAALLK